MFTEPNDMEIMLYIFALIGLMAVVFLAIDGWLAFQQWQKRIHIGRWSDTEQWAAAIDTVCRRWMKRTPIVVQKQNRLLLWDILSGRHKNATIQYWQKAGLLLGETTCTSTPTTPTNRAQRDFSDHPGGGEPDTLWFVQRQIDLTTGAWRYPLQHVDIALLGYAILLQRNIDTEQVRPAMEQVYQLLLQAKGTGDTLPYRGTGGSTRFVDTIGLVCPFLIKYAQCYSVAEAQQLALRQLHEYDAALHPRFGLPPHAYDLRTQLPRGIYDWGRGNGWYILGLVEMYRQLSTGSDKEELANRIIQLSNNLLPFQLSTGGFASQLFATDLPAEGSATALAGLLFHEAYRLTGETRYKEAVTKVLKCLMQMTQRGGELDLCQGDTIGIGNYSTYHGYMPFAQGMLLLLIKRTRHENA